jgi:hypothetical protein
MCEYTTKLCIVYITTLTEFEDGLLEQNLNHYLKNITSEFKFDIILYFDNFPKRFRKFKNRLNKFSKCINVNEIILVDNQLDSEENFYLKDKSIKVDLKNYSMGGSHGISLHFYRSVVDLFQRNYNNFMLLEADTISVKSDWFDVLHNYCDNNDFLIAGSKYKGKEQDLVFDTYYGGEHINGVALYKNNKDTQNLITKSKQFLINSLAKDEVKSKRHRRCNGFMNYDVAIYLLAKKNKVDDQLKDVDFITNMSLPFDDDTKVKSVVSKYPQTRIIHKKNLYKESEHDIKSTIKILKENKVYRIADLFYMDGTRWEIDRATIVHSKEYKNTILYDYMLKKTGEFDYDAFKSITLKHSEKYELKPEEDDLVFHLRLGDVFDVNGETKIYNRADWSYLQYKVFFRKNREFLETLNGVKVVTALHFGSDELTGDFYYTDEHYTESMKFFDYFCGRLQDFGCNVDVISNENIDQDICYMMQAKHFVPGLTKLSTLISKCIETDAKLYRDPIKKYI